jgi:hypothetical protein
MSQRHQSSRRRAYGRRQHEVRERRDRVSVDWLDQDEMRENAEAEEPAQGASLLDLFSGGMQFETGR